MNFPIAFLFLLVASFVLVTATTALAIACGLLPGARLWLLGKTSGQTILRKSWSYDRIAQTASTSVEATSEATVQMQGFKVPMTAPLVMVQVTSEGNLETLLGTHALAVVTLRLIARHYRVLSQTQSELVEEAA